MPVADRHADESGAYRGAALGSLAKTGRDKVTVIASPSLTTFGLWVEQLLAESTGKEGDRPHSHRSIGNRF